MDHLAGDGALPVQAVQLELIRRQIGFHIIRAALHRGRANGLVRLLGILRFGFIFTRLARHHVLAVLVADKVA